MQESALDSWKLIPLANVKKEKTKEKRYEHKC